MNEPPANPPPTLPGKGLLGWLGRQVGYVRKALGSEVSAEQTIYRKASREEKPLPDDPNVKLRRTVIDEVVVEKPKEQGEDVR